MQISASFSIYALAREIQIVKRLEFAFSAISSGGMKHCGYKSQGENGQIRPQLSEYLAP